MATQAQDPILAENEAVRQLKEGYKYGWSDATNYVEKPQRGLSHDVIDQRRRDVLGENAQPQRQPTLGSRRRNRRYRRYGQGTRRARDRTRIEDRGGRLHHRSSW